MLVKIFEWYQFELFVIQEARVWGAHDQFTINAGRSGAFPYPSNLCSRDVIFGPSELDFSLSKEKWAKQRRDFWTNLTTSPLFDY